jgi:hypothetical protein
MKSNNEAKLELDLQFLGNLMWSIPKQLQTGLVFGHRVAAWSQGVKLIELMLNEFLRIYLSWNRSMNSSHDTLSMAMFESGRSIFCHRRALLFS